MQNHLLQVLALVAMEPPSGFDRDVFLTERIRLLQAIRPLKPTTSSAASSTCIAAAGR